MGKLPKVAIIMSTYNGEKFVGLKNYETLSKIVEEKGATKRKR